MVGVKPDRRMPEGTVFILGGATFRADAANWHTNAYKYSLSPSSDFGMVEGQKMTVSVKFPASATAATGWPTISGRPQVGEVVTAGTDDIADADGLGAFSYQWVRMDGLAATDIPGATASTYAPEAADVGKRLMAKVSFTDGAGNAEEVISDAWPTKGYPKPVIAAAKTGCPTDAGRISTRGRRSAG